MRLIQSPILLSMSFVLISMPLLQAQRQWDKGCESKLDDAKMYYESGLLEKVVGEDGVKTCLDSKHSLSKEKRIEGYRLLTETNLYQNQIGMADENFKSVLRLDPLYRVDTTDPTASYDLIYLARTFRRKPMISVYGGAGVNYSRLEVLQTYGTDNTSDPHTDLNDIVVGFNGTVGMEIPVWRNFDFAMDVNFLLRTYKFLDSLYANVTITDARQNDEITSVDPDAALRYGAFSFRENQLWIDIPVMARYNFGEKKIIPYIYVGANANFMISAALNGVRRTTVEEADLNAGNQVEENVRIRISQYTDRPETQGGQAIKYLSLRNTFNFSLVAGAGVKIRVGRNFLFADLRYTRFFFNMANPENRYSRPELMYRFNYVSNDFKMDALSLNVGFMASFYKPTKKRAYDDKVLQFRLDKLLRDQRRKAKNVTDKALRNNLESSIKTLGREQRSIINDVKSGQRNVEQSIQKARDILKGTSN